MKTGKSGAFFDFLSMRGIGFAFLIDKTGVKK